MAFYRVQIEGQNFLTDAEGLLAKRGFFTFRVVEADDPKAAENLAVQMIRDDSNLRKLVRNGKEDPPVMDVIEIVELDSFQGEATPPGRVWYEMNPKRWWQFWRR